MNPAELHRIIQTEPKSDIKLVISLIPLHILCNIYVVQFVTQTIAMTKSNGMHGDKEQVLEKAKNSTLGHGQIWPSY